MAFVRNPIVYVPDLTNGRPVVDGKVYLLAKGTIAPTHSSSINPATLLAISYINEAGNTVPQPQPLYTSKGGCLYGSYPDEARQFSLAEQEYVFAVYNRIGRLEYAGHYTNSALSADYVGETAPLTPFQGMRWYNPSIPTTFIYYVDANSAQWVEEVRQGGDSPFVTPEMFGAKGDGVTDDTAAILEWAQFVIDNGVTGSAKSDGVCLISSGISLTLNGSATFDLPAGFVFKASAGFPAQKMFLVNTGLGSDHVFRWKGGQLNGENIPLSGSGQANDMFYFTAANCARCDLYFDRTYSGEDWLNSGSDSHVFVAGVRNVRVEIGDAVGAFDSAVYISGDFAGVVGENCEIYGNYTKCNVAAIVKRRFKTTTIDINTTDCKNGGGSGGADISGFASAPGGDGLKVKVNALRTERPCFFQATSGAIVEVVSRQIGVSIDGYTSTDAFTVLLSGSSNISGDVVVDGVNPACTVNGNFVGVYSDQRVFATGTYSSENNNFNIIAKGIGRSVLEDSTGSNNIYYITESGNFFPNSIAGTGSKFIQNSLAGYLMDAGFIRLANGFRVQKVDNAVNNIRVDGSVTTSASGCILTTEGSDANIPLSIIPKGTANTFIGGSAGAESLRVGKGAASGNAIEIPSAAAGQSTKIMARGTDANINITIEPKGTGKNILTISKVLDFADDAAANAGGVPVGGIYRTGSILKIRVS